MHSVIYFTIYGYLREYRRINPAFHDPVFANSNLILIRIRPGNGEIENGRLLRLQHENIVILDAVHCQFRQELHRLGLVFVKHIIRRCRGSEFTVIILRRFTRIKRVSQHPLRIGRSLILHSVVNLVREPGVGRLSFVRTLEFLVQLYGTFFDGSQVELHVQVGSTCTALHVEDAHGVLGAVFENPLSRFVLFE